MRIVGGKYRGKKLFSPESEGVRPTSDRAREAVFNILYSRLEEPWSAYHLLDVFSGTGAFGLEAVSRGAAAVTLLDKDTRNLLKNMALFPKEKTRISVIKADVANLPQPPKRFGIVFMDAPYNKGLSEIALQNLANKDWLEDGALCMVETEKNEQIVIPACYKVENERIYGLAKIIFLTYVKQEL